MKEEVIEFMGNVNILLTEIIANMSMSYALSIANVFECMGRENEGEGLSYFNFNHFKLTFHKRKKL